MVIVKRVVNKVVERNNDEGELQKPEEIRGEYKKI